MKMRSIALGLALAFSAPAFAATANVDIAGTIDMSLGSIDGQSNVSSNNSNIVLKGAEDLGGGLSAIWQAQTYFGANGTDSKAASDGRLSNGNTFVGLRGGFGTVRLGNHDTPVKDLGRKADLFNNRLADSRNLTQETYGDVRAKNSVSYVSPSFGGFSASALYSSNLTATAGSSADPSLYSLAGTYESGPLFAGIGYEKTSLAAGDDPATLRLAGGYAIWDAKIVALWQRQENASGAASVSDDRDVWGIGGSYKVSEAASVKAQYYRAGDLGSASDTGADMWAIGADYRLSKRTGLYATYAKTSNDSGAAFSVSGGGHGDNMGAALGSSTSGFQVGMAHSF